VTDEPSYAESLGDLAADFAAVSRVLQAQPGVQPTLDTICRLSIAVVDGAEAAGLTVVRSGKFFTQSATDDIPGLVDQLQYEANEGPCVVAIRDDDVVESPDLTRECRWPTFTRAVLERSPVRSMLSFRLFWQDDTLGALNFYANSAEAFSDDGRAIGAIFATHAAVAWRAARNEEQNENLNAALVSSRRIGSAIGILMVRHGLTEEAAFDRLRLASQHSHRKVRDLAEEVVFTGTLGPAPPGE
jgi:GAF domain-containing protein